MNEMGYIKLFRTIQEWEWFDDPNTLALWVHLLVDANWKETEWHGEIIPRGSFITSVSKLASEVGLSDRQIRTCLGRLEKTGEIIREGTNKWTMITVCKYDTYQMNDEPECHTEKQTEIGRQEVDKRPIEEEKKERKVEAKKTVPLSDVVNRIYALYPSTTKRPEGNRVALKSSKKNKAHITRMLGSGEYTEETLTYIIKRYLEETKPEYLKSFETFMNQVPDYGNNEQQEQKSPERPTYDEAIEKAKNPTKEEIKAWWDKRMAPFYPKSPGESKEQYRERVRPSYESELRSWIENRVEHVNQKYL